MPKTIDPHNRPATITFGANAEIWGILLAARIKRPFDSLSEIVREDILVAAQLISTEAAKAEVSVTKVESINP